MNDRSDATPLSRRRILASGASGAAAALAAACSTGREAPSNTPATPKSLTGAVAWLVRDNAQELEWEKSVVIPEFAKLQPQVTIELIPGGNAASFDAKLTSLVVGGQSPELWTHHGGRSYVDYMKNGWLDELTPLVARDKLDLNAFLPNTVEWFRNQNKLWAMPYYQSYGSFVFYNKQLFERAGLKPPPADPTDRSWTWDTMTDMAKKLTRNTGGPDGQFGLTAFADGAQFLSQTMAMLFGGDIFLPEHYKEGIAQRTQLDSPQAIEGHQARQDLIYRQQVIPTAADTRALGITGDAFQAGKVAININAGWQVRNYTLGIKDFQWGIAPIPAKRKSAGPQFTDAWMLGKQAKNKESGWALIRYLVTPDAQRAFIRATGSGGAIKAAEDEWFKLMGDRQPIADVRKVTEFALKNSFELSQHTFAKWSEILAAVRGATTPLWRNEATASDALRAGKAQVDQVVAQAYAEFKGAL